MVVNKWLNSTVKTYTDNFGLIEDPIIYEVGSRDGHDGVELAIRISVDRYNMKNVVLFECNPPQIEAIRKEYPEATLITSAISDKESTVEFLQIHGDKNMMGSSTMNTKRSDSWIRETSTIKVNTRRLDDVIQELGHKKTEIDVMKIDIEGYTAEALRSLGNYLRNVRVFHLETELPPTARAETNLDIALFMRTNGYKCSYIEYEWPPNIEDQVWIRIGDV